MITRFLKLILFFSPNLVAIFLHAQNPEDFKVIELENTHSIAAIEISPDQKTLAISNASGTIFLWDIASQKVSRKIDLTGYNQGPYLSYSNDGRFLLLVEQHYTSFAINKDRPSKVEVMEIATGKIMISKAGVHSAALSPDNKSLLTLKSGEVTFWNIESGSEERKFTVPNATNSVAINPKGDVIVVSQKPTEEDLRNIPSMRDDKKAIKEALKFREIAVFYDAKTFTKKFMVTDIFDIVFSMHFSGDGSTLYLFNAPNTRLRASDGAARNGYIQSANASDGSVSRVIFPTGATEPQYKESPDRKFFATTSIQQRFRVLNSVDLFDRETGQALKNFTNDFRLFEDVHTGRASFEFLPDNQTIILMYGSKLAIWKIQ